MCTFDKLSIYLCRQLYHSVMHVRDPFGWLMCLQNTNPNRITLNLSVLFIFCLFLSSMFFQSKILPVSVRFFHVMSVIWSRISWVLGDRCFCFLCESKRTLSRLSLDPFDTAFMLLKIDAQPGWVKTCANCSNIVKHVWPFDHRIYFDSSSAIDKGSFCIRKTLEAWHTSATKHADNDSKACLMIWRRVVPGRRVTLHTVPSFTERLYEKS